MLHAPKRGAKRSRWLAATAGAATLAVATFAIMTGVGAARTAVKPDNTSPPVISGKAQVGELLTASRGTWSGTTPMTFSYQWRICGSQGEACRDIANANGDEYLIKAADKGNTIRVVVTARNSDGSDSATSVPTAQIADAGAPAPAPTPSTGCPKLAAGATSVEVADVSSPARLQIASFQSSPGVITRGVQSFTLRVRVADTCGNPVRGALLFATGLPYNMINVPSELQTDANGWVEFNFNMLQGWPATPKQQLLVMFLRARKSGENLLAGVSTRRLISLPVNLRR